MSNHSAPTALPSNGSAGAADTKASLRAEARRWRDVLAADAAAQARRAAALAARLAALPQLQAARLVASYAPTRGELDPNGFRALLVPPPPPPRLLFPRVCGSRSLSLHACEPAELQPGAFGILEPEEAAPCVGVQEAAVILLPGLAFDRQGARLGYGKGYYDSLLAGLDGSVETSASAEVAQRAGASAEVAAVAATASAALVAPAVQAGVAGVDVLPQLLDLSRAAETRPLLVGISYDETLVARIPAEPHDVRVDVVVTPTQTLWVTHD